MLYNPFMPGYDARVKVQKYIVILYGRFLEFYFHNLGGKSNSLSTDSSFLAISAETHNFIFYL